MSELDISIRPARENDSAIIKQMVKQERLDPTSLKWKNFLIAEVEDEIVGLGQVKQLPNCEELGSLITKKAYRGKGVGEKLISALEARAGRPLYLLCESKMEAYYQRFDYESVSWWDAPAFLKLKLAPAVIARLFGIRVLVMRKI